MQRIAEGSGGELNLGQADAWSFGDESADPPRRRPLVTFRIVAVKQDKIERVSQADVVEVARLPRDPSIACQRCAAEAGIGGGLARSSNTCSGTAACAASPRLPVDWLQPADGEGRLGKTGPSERGRGTCLMRVACERRTLALWRAANSAPTATRCLCRGLGFVPRVAHESNAIRRT
jgi:hypothetical protein